MDYNAKFRESLNKHLFLEIEKKKLLEYFPLNDMVLKEDFILLPINSQYIVNGSKAQENLSMVYFIEGMFYVLGADPSFKYNTEYKAILSSNSVNSDYIKSKIAEYFKKEEFEKTFILLRGLLEINNDKEVFRQAINVGELIRSRDNEFSNIQLALLENYKEYYQNDEYPDLIEGLIAYSNGDLGLANIKLHNYIARGGEEIEEIHGILEDIKEQLDYKKASELVASKPEESLRILLERLNLNPDDPYLLYYIAVAYRNLELYEKAIYYLNEALAIDSSFIDVINELGINYAAIKNYDMAIEFFRKAFEATRSIDICCNLALCYYYNKDIEKAKQHVIIAEKLDSNDEILADIKELIFKGEY
ncbi:MAG: capsular biosynthesis protein [Clostridiaceae bacterium]